MATLRTNLLLVRAFALAIKIRVSMVEVQSYGIALQLFLNSGFRQLQTFICSLCFCLFLSVTKRSTPVSLDGTHTFALLPSKTRFCWMQEPIRDSSAWVDSGCFTCLEIHLSKLETDIPELDISGRPK